MMAVILPVENSGDESSLSGVHTAGGPLDRRPQADVGAAVPGHLGSVGPLPMSQWSYCTLLIQGGGQDSITCTL